MSGMEYMVGSIASVDDVPAGDDVRDAHTAGELQLRLRDAADFAETGGQVDVAGTVLEYSAADLATDVLTLTAPLPQDVAEDTPAWVHPRSPSRVAVVTTPGGVEPLLARVPQSLLDQVPTGLRSRASAETVTVDVVDGQWQVRDVVGAESRAVDPSLVADLDAALATAREWISDTGATLETLLGSDEAIPQAVIEHLWAAVVRARKITTDMLLVGSGENLVPDPYLLDDALSDARLAVSSGPWSYGTDGTARVAALATTSSTSYLRLTAGAPGAGPERFYPITGGGRYRLRYDHRVVGLGTAPTVRPAVRYVTSSGASYLVIPRTATVSSAAGWQTDEVVWDAPASAVGAQLEVAATNPGAGQVLQVRRPSVTSMLDASLLVDGTIRASLAIEADGSLRVGLPSQVHVLIRDGRVDVMSPGDAGDAPAPYISMGKGADGAFRVLDTGGGVLGGVMPDGSYDGPEVRADSVILAGTPLLERVAERLDVLGEFRTDPDVTYGPYTVDMPLLEVSVDVPAGHQLRLDARGWMRGTSGELGLLRCSYTTATGTTTPPRPGGGDTEADPYCPVLYGPSWVPATWTWSIPVATVDRRVRALLWIFRQGTTNPEARNFVVTPSLYRVPDAPAFAGTVRANPGSSGTVPSPPPPLVTRTTRHDLGPHSLWADKTRATYGYRLGDVQIGKSDSGLLWETLIRIPSAALSEISAAEELVSARVRLSGSQTPRASIRPRIGTTATSSVTPSSFPAVQGVAPGSRTYTVETPSGWTTLGAATIARLKAGDPTLYLTYPSTSQTCVRFQGPGTASAVRPQIEITTRSRT